MFSLIVSIISIALVAVLAAASIYYGGDAFVKGSAKALASTVVTQAQQISSAHTLYKNDEGGSEAPSIQALVVGGYLASVPAAPVNVAADTDTNTTGKQPAPWVLGANDVTLAVDNDEVCALINEQANGTSAFSSNAQFGCQTNGATMSFVYNG